MIFDRARPDHASVDPCVLLGPHSPRAAAEYPRQPAEAVKRKSVEFRHFGVSIRVQSVGIFAFTLSQSEFLSVLLFPTKSSVRTVTIGVVGELIFGDAFYWGS